MNRKKDNKTELFRMPIENAKLIHERISGFLAMYSEEQRLQTLFFEKPPRNNFDLMALCYSCYTQGALDADQAIKSIQNEKIQSERDQ